MQATIQVMKQVFARQGIPEEIYCDNMPFDSHEFKSFASMWGIQVKTSSPNYPKSHGQVERYVQTIKQLLRKTKSAQDDPNLALLEFRNTPVTGMKYSPAEMLIGRKLRSTLPIANRNLLPRKIKDVREQLLQRQITSKKFHDPSAKPLSDLNPTDTIRIHKNNEWQPAVVMSRHAAPRSYHVITAEGAELRRNRSQLLQTKEPMPSIIPSSEDLETDSRTEMDTKTREISIQEPNDSNMSQYEAAKESETTVPKESANPIHEPAHSAPRDQHPLRRSARQIKKPKKYSDFVK
jgi:hypothetical protein